MTHPTAATASGRSTTAGPLLSAWGAAAGPRALARTLLSPERALPVPSVADRAAWERAARDAAGVLAALREDAEAQRGQPWPQPLASHYARYFRDGDRAAYEDQVFERQARLTRAVLLAAADGAEHWVDEAADGLVLLCEQSSWCWPAHEEGCAPGGAVLPEVREPCLDLGAADVAAQLAWADQVLGPRLDTRFPGLRRRIRTEAHARVLRPFALRRDWHWLGLDGRVHNWCPWICGNVLVTALRLAEPGEQRARLVALAAEGLDRYLGALPADGSVDEGYEYWWNGACRALEALEVLEHATEGALGAVGIPVVRETLRFPHRMHLGGRWYLNLADARARPPGGRPWDVVHRWARRLGEEPAVRHAAAEGRAAQRPPAELGRALGALTDAAWHTTGTVAPPLVGSVWLPGTQVALARPAAGSCAGLTLAVKGGHNGENHNHNDVGSVVVAVDGVPVLVDAGRPTYTARTFGPDRYAIWTMRSEWHNVPLIRGVPQGTGDRFRARDAEVTDLPERFEVRLDLAPAYPVPGLEHWRRRAVLDRRTGRVTVEDAWRLTGPAGSGPSAVHWLIAGTAKQRAPGELFIRPLDNARPVLLNWDPGRAEATRTSRTLDDPLLTAVWGESLTRLELRLPDTACGTLEIRMDVLE
jgi:hypothetical protein